MRLVGAIALIFENDHKMRDRNAAVPNDRFQDSPLKEHTLLQTIARVNRKEDGKTYGLVVDYWGVSDSLQEALAIFSPSDVRGAMKPKSDELPRLQSRHAAALRFFQKVKDKNDLDECVAVLEPEDVRADFDQDFKAFSESLDMLLPDPRALPYVDDLRWLGKVRGAARARYRDQSLDISDCGAKVRKLIEEVVIAEGIQLLVKEVSIFSKDFEEKVDQLRSPEAKASEMEHAIRHEIHVKLDENPAFYSSLKERLEKLIEDRKQKRIDAAKQLELLQAMVEEVRGEAKAADNAGMHPFAFAIYGLLDEGRALTAAEPDIQYDTSTKELAGLLQDAVELYTGIIDWTQKDDVQREMRQKIKKQLRAARIDENRIEGVTGQIVNLAKIRLGR